MDIFDINSWREVMGAFFLIILAVLFIFISFSVILRSRKKIIHLALTKFIVDQDSKYPVVIEGRRTGLIQWLLVQLRLGNLYKIYVKKDYIIYSEDSMSGFAMDLTPVHKVASTSCGFHRPILLLILAGLIFVLYWVALFYTLATTFDFAFGGFAISFLLVLILDALLIIIYIFRKNFYIAIYTVGGVQYRLSFKRSFIENVDVNMRTVEDAIFLINDLVLASNRK
jgi:hypothetical protein